jgi:hypothetical protein
MAEIGVLFWLSMLLGRATRCELTWHASLWFAVEVAANFVLYLLGIRLVSAIPWKACKSGCPVALPALALAHIGKLVVAIAATVELAAIEGSKSRHVVIAILLEAMCLTFAFVPLVWYGVHACKGSSAVEPEPEPKSVPTSVPEQKRTSQLVLAPKSEPKSEPDEQDPECEPEPVSVSATASVLVPKVKPAPACAINDLRASPAPATTSPAPATTSPLHVAPGPACGAVVAPASAPATSAPVGLVAAPTFEVVAAPASQVVAAPASEVVAAPAPEPTDETGPLAPRYFDVTGISCTGLDKRADTSGLSDPYIVVVVIGTCITYATISCNTCA